MRFILIISWVFLIQSSAMALSRTEANTLFTRLKKQTTNLVLVNERSQAVALIDDELKRADIDYKSKLNDLKFNILNQFLSLPTQEAFETAATILLSDKKKALANLQLCLSLEADNLQCQWLELRYLRRYSSNSFTDKALVYIEKIKDFRQMQLMRYSLLTILGQFNEVPVNLRIKPTNPEEGLLLNMINYDLAVQTHDYNRAKEAVNYFSQHTPDYPDLVFMNYQMLQLWPERTTLSTNEAEKQNEVYKKKCADLASSVARKYFYDISMCIRGLK